MLTDVEVFAIRAAGLPEHLREKLYPELTLRCASVQQLAALDRLAENERDLGLDYMTAPTCEVRDADQA